MVEPSFLVNDPSFFPLEAVRIAFAADTYVVVGRVGLEPWNVSQSERVACCATIPSRPVTLVNDCIGKHSDM